MLKKTIAVAASIMLAATVFVATSDNPVEAAAPVLMGVHDDVAPKDLAKRYPGVRATREFVNGVQSTKTDLRKKYAGVAQASWDAGLIPFVSIKTAPEATGSGMYDVRFRELAVWLKEQPDTYFIWYHEPENDMDGQTFAKAFKRVRDVMKAANPQVKVGYSAMAFQWDGRPRTKDPKPWRVEADFYGADTYSGGTQPATAIVSEHAGHVRWYREVVQQTPGAAAKWGLTERGFKGTKSDQARASEIDRETAYLDGLPAGSRPAFYLYWNTKGTEGDPDLVNGPKAQAAVARMVGKLG
ncbi:hypothetical protein EV649_5247 [Kribbella sp. VKM Ac-2569]|uniref:hypothetical protein n=1 Tax=Kribbella sp. VKM Ac-2569 TaxID=2512220 RepID=UPI00102BD9F9|nr:hypothetical protein [Kribbella sp. VKM Ac-2569]RZT17690.1 hypothetical protein EV649_5247 [Kribbella sp. VKM Ac-2569]